jgi:hypothetical protein
VALHPLVGRLILAGLASLDEGLTGETLGCLGVGVVSVHAADTGNRVDHAGADFALLLDSRAQLACGVDHNGRGIALATNKLSSIGLINLALRTQRHRRQAVQTHRIPTGNIQRPRLLTPRAFHLSRLGVILTICTVCHLRSAQCADTVEVVAALALLALVYVG